MAASAPVVAVPLVALAPDHVPDAVQLVALVDDHVSVELAPLATVVGLALRLTVGSGTTATLMDLFAVPPGPVHVSVKPLVAASAPVVAVPLVALAPDHVPDAVQLVALVDDHVSVEFPPALTVVGLALRLTVGCPGGLPVTVMVVDASAIPPAPEHVNV